MICHRLALGSQVCDISSNYQLFLNLIYNSRSESKTLIILTYFLLSVFLLPVMQSNLWNVQDSGKLYYYFTC